MSQNKTHLDELSTTRRIDRPLGSVRPFISAIILAAGESKRMGVCKQLMKIGNRTLLEHTLSGVSRSKVSETLLVLGYQADTILKKIHLNDATNLIINKSYADGMSTSIKVGLRAIAPDSKGVLIVLADQPFIKAPVIDQLIVEYETSHAPILVPIYKGFRGNPVLIDRSLFEEMMQIRGDIGCRSLFGLHAEKIHKAPVDDIGILIDIDTMEDFKKLGALSDYRLNEVLSGLELHHRSVDDTQDKAQTRQLVVVGHDAIATSLSKLGKLLKFQITVVDPLLSKENVPEADEIVNALDFTKVNVTRETYIVIASRGKFDEEALEQAVGTGAKYIALVGSKKRGAEILQRLRANEISDERLERVRSPAGLEIHASSSEEIALSILAEIVSISRIP